MAASQPRPLWKTLFLVLAFTLGTTAIISYILNPSFGVRSKEAPTQGQERAMTLGPENPPSPESFAPSRVVAEKPPIRGVKVVPASQAGAWVQDDELVLGVVIGTQARAYPINMLTGPDREIVNDQLSGRAIAATW